MNSGDSSRALQCAACSQPLGEDEAIHLWDGMDYCPRCVSQASPRLLQWAKQNSVFHEALVVPQRAELRAMLVNSVLTIVVLVGAAILIFPPKDRLPGAAVLGAIALLVSVIFGIGQYWQIQQYHGWVEVCDGTLRVRHDVIGCVTWKLHECRWRECRINRAQSIFLPRVSLRRKVIVIECPLNTRFPLPRTLRVPCGMQAETREVWKAFLQLAKIRRVPTRRWLRAAWSAARLGKS